MIYLVEGKWPRERKWTPHGPWWELPYQAEEHLKRAAKEYPEHKFRVSKYARVSDKSI